MSNITERKKAGSRLDLQWFAESGGAVTAAGSAAEAGQTGGKNSGGGTAPAAVQAAGHAEDAEDKNGSPAAAGRSGETAAPEGAAAKDPRPAGRSGEEEIAGAAGILPGREIAEAEAAGKAATPDPRMERGKQAIRNLCAGWLREGDELKRIYPGFDLRAELRAPDFVRMLKSGVSLRAAYQAVHMDELLGGAMQYAADKAAEAAAARMAERARRPAENGAQPQAGAVFHTDVARLSRAQREEIERRAARGEQILF